MSSRPATVRIGPRPGAALVLASAAGLAMFVWPLLWHHGGQSAHRLDAPFVFILIVPVLIAVVIAELSAGGMDAKALAMLGVLSALGAALRPIGAGTAGIETVFFVLVLAGRVYGAGFGFVLGATTLFASALLTGGVGPWLPFQMLGAAWVGMGAGLLPKATGRTELALLAVYGAISAYAFGFLLNLFFWPFTTGVGGSSVAFVPGAAVATNLHRFMLYCLATSTWGWDTGRALTTVVAILLVGSPLLLAMRRSARRAAFDEAVRFTPSLQPVGVETGR